MNKPLLIRQKLAVLAHNFTDYKKLIGEREFAAIKNLANQAGKQKIVYVNSTPSGGGVAELMKNLIPLLRDLGVEAEWCAFDDDKRFFEISKKLHNSLQGSNEKLTPTEKEFYLRHNESLARQLLKLKPDVVMLQDPQPLAIAQFLPEQVCAAARIHIDLTAPNKDSMRFMQKFFECCRKLVFTMQEFAPQGLDQSKIVFSPPAIDPFSAKNEILTAKQISAVAESIGVDERSPVLVQVARFDKWKDPEGAVQIYRLVKQDYPRTQLVLMGLIEAADDPEAKAVFENVKNYVGTDPNVFLISSRAQLLGIRVDTFVNAIQRIADVVLQKSIREGFGLTVTEAMWKKKAVIGGDVGGIRLQISNGENGYLTDSIAEAARLAVKLISDKRLNAQLGAAAKKTVEKHFLLSRYIKDELQVISSLR